MKLKKRPYCSYFQIIDAFQKAGATAITLDAVYEGGAAGKHFCLRHDVDYDLDTAVTFAEKEAARKLSASYYILPTAKYFDYSKSFFDKVKKIQDLGHTIGLHNNYVGLSITDPENAYKEAFTKPLKKLRRRKIRITSTAAHGDKLCYKHKRYNYEIWNTCDPKKVHCLSDLSHKQFDLKTLGLNYEVYFLDYDFYLSKCGSDPTWTGIRLHPGLLPRVFERDLKEADYNVGKNIIKKFTIAKHGVMHVLTHPIHWMKI